MDNRSNIIAPSVILLAVMCIPETIGQVFLPSKSIEQSVIISTLFLLLFSFPAMWAFISARQYQIDSNGITIRYPFGVECKYRWHELSEIALCKIHYAAGSTAHTLAIRCVVGEEHFGPAQATTSKEWWSTMGYEVVHFKHIVSIYYTAERYAEFLNVCPYLIKDYRHLKDRN